MELSKLQEAIIDAPYNKVVVIASPAAGKTQCMTEKVRRLLRAGVNPREIAVITFTNMAAGALRQRLGDDYKDGIFIGTVHSLANYMLRVNGVDTSKVLNNENFDELFQLVVDHPDCVHHYEWVLLDEAQDSSDEQFHFLFNMIDPEHFFVVGDPRQSIFGFAGADPSLMTRLCKKPNVHLLELNENYRNGSNILTYAQRIIAPTGWFDDSRPMRQISGVVKEVFASVNDIPNYIKEYDTPGDWAVLCRTNNEVMKVSQQLNIKQIPCDTFRQGDLTNEELAKKMESNTVKVLTIHSAKGLEWKNVIVMGTRFFPQEERNVCYVGATRARDRLIWVKSSKPKQKMYKW